MINNMLLDVACKRGITACVLEYKGKVVSYSTFESSYDNQYENMIEGYTRGVNLARKYLEELDSFSGTLMLVTNNVVFVGWLRKNFAPDKYAELFMQLTTAIDSLPVKTEFARNRNIVADKYAKPTLLKHDYSGIDSFLD